jgi:hypothetical protein
VSEQDVIRLPGDIDLRQAADCPRARPCHL